MSRFIGVDPGKKGAIAILDGYGEIVALDDMPVAGNAVSGTLLTDFIEDSLNGVMPGDDAEGEFVHAVVEQVHSMPKQGVASSFDFGKSYGIVLGVLAGARIPWVDVSPIRWKRSLRLSADKEQARRRALERWPRHAELFKFKKHSDRAEAALLALWLVESRS